MSTNLDPRNVTVGEAAPAEPRTEAQITADLERQRAELASARFASFKESASLTLRDAAGGNVEALKKVGVVALSAVGAIGLIVLLATRSSRRSRREARRAAREAAARTLEALKSDATEAL